MDGGKIPEHTRWPVARSGSMREFANKEINAKLGKVIGSEPIIISAA